LSTYRTIVTAAQTKLLEAARQLSCKDFVPIGSETVTAFNRLTAAIRKIEHLKKRGLIYMTPMTKNVAVLFARSDSLYATMPGCDVYTAERDARSFPGGKPVIAHPPCRAWGRLRHFAKPLPGEKELALFAVEQVRKNGGVLEHPFKSTLWKAAGLPRIGERDAWGGYTICFPQWWLGHRAEKASLFYIVGVEPDQLPPLPLRIGEAEFVIQSRKRSGHKPHVPKRERELTPAPMAAWLYKVAEKVRARELSI